MLALRLGVAIGLVPLALVGCGGGSAAPPVASLGTTTARTQPASTAASAPATTGPSLPRLVAYSSCMRRNGVPTFPDPTTRGNLLITPGDDIDPTSAQYRRAQRACAKLSPETGAGMTPAQHAKALATMTRYARCMRKHGIPVADPFSGPNGGVGIALPRNVDLGSQQYKQADAACRHFIPNGG
jgi:hypothetical protein